MFEKIIEAKVNSEVAKVKNLIVISMNSLRDSKLSDFTKNFIKTETDSIQDKTILFNLIDKSVKLNFNYALRPKWTILNYLFGNLDSKPVSDVLNKLEIFEFYIYYTEHIADYINESGLVVITKDKIRNLIEEVDSELHQKFTNNITGIKIRNFFIQLFKLKYEDETLVGLDSTIPYSFLRLFLEDKMFSDLFAKFRKIESIKDENEIDLMTITKILTDKFSEADVPITQERNPEIVKPTDEKIELPIPVESKPAKEPEADEIIQPALFPEEFTEEQFYYSPKKIKGLFKKSELKFILKKIFRSDNSAMDTAFRELDNIDRWDNASEYLKNLFLTNKVNIRNSKIVLFVDVLNEYFNKKDNG
jgi:hypothetical protein